MSFAAAKWAVQQDPGSSSALFVLYRLADYADDTGKAWPSQGTLARELLLSVRQVGRAMRELSRRRFIFRERRNRRDGMRTSDDVFLNLPWLPQALDRGEPIQAGKKAPVSETAPEDYRTACPVIGDGYRTNETEPTGHHVRPGTIRINHQEKPPTPPSGGRSPALAWALPQVTHPIEPILVPVAVVHDQAGPVELVERNGVFEPVDSDLLAETSSADGVAAVQVETATFPSVTFPAKGTAVTGLYQNRKPTAGPRLLPDDWVPAPRHYDKASAEGFTATFVDDVADAMRSWCRSNAHRKIAQKSNWDAAFDRFLRGDMAAARRRPSEKSQLRNGYLAIGADIYDRQTRQGQGVNAAFVERPGSNEAMLRLLESGGF